MFSNYEISLIKRSDSRRYFEDVLQSYYSKNYRASILLLYNLTIDDLYYKLILMNDRKYINLNQELTKIETLSKNASKYSEVEDEIYKIYKNRNILNHDTIDVLEFFKKIRNKCAHPSFFKEQSYNPSAEEVYMLIKRIYYDILIIEAFIKDPYEIIKDDIEGKNWGNITDILMGFENHEENYAVFKQYFINKYLKNLTDNNFKKLFNTLIKLIILKKENWTIVNQYKNMMLMESIIDYLNDKGKINILYSKYNWINITEESLVDDDNPEIYNREWFALTNFYKILKKIPCFVNEIKAQNLVVYNYIKEKLIMNEQYISNYWEIFYNEFDEVIKEIQNNNNTFFYHNILENIKTLNKQQIKKILYIMFKTIPTYGAFDMADIACDTLISQIKNMELENDDISDILNLMNNNKQIYSKERRNSILQLKTIRGLGIKLENYDNLNELIGD